jgi:glycosyltransferase involved in cell wall biosynthesis
MRLLIITQSVDAKDPILGFFLRWIRAFAVECDHVTVLGQRTGEFDLPSNVTVHSLGKEKGFRRSRQIFRCLRLLWSLRKQYDAVFVHMTPVWVVLGAPVFLLLRTPVFLWYEARGGGLALAIALHIVRRVFSATSYGLPRASRKHTVVGHGVDTLFFQPDPSRRDPHLVCAIGRITRVKHLDQILRAFAALPDDAQLMLAGAPITQQDTLEWERLQALMVELNIGSRVSIQKHTQEEIRDLLQRSSLLLHAGSGGLDKVLLEAMASGCLVATSSHAASFALPEGCLATAQTLPARAQEFFLLENDAREKLAHSLRERAEHKHGLSRLITQLCQTMRNTSASS